MTDRLDSMRLFVRVADGGSFSRAAEEAGLGQPTVSRRIAELEAELGAPLFRRTTRALSLTEGGERFLERARALLDEFDEATAEVRGLERELVGRLRVTAPLTLGRLIVAPAAAAFIAQHPHVKLDLRLDNAFVDLAAEGVDLAFRVGALVDSALIARRLGVLPKRLFASPDYLQRVGVPLAPADLSAASFLMFPANAAPSVSLFQEGVQVDVEVAVRLRSNAPEVVVEGALANLGVGAAPCILVRALTRSGQLVELLPDWRLEENPIHALWPAGRRLGAKARAFLEHVADAITQAGYGLSETDEPHTPPQS